jgi:hypothetical protein
MYEVIENQVCSILNSNETLNTEEFSNFKVIPIKKNTNEYVSSFNSFAVKTAQSTIEMCRVVCEAKRDLTKVDFDQFCLSIGRKQEEKDSTIKKYLAIGERYADFMAYAERLPNSWTSIYLITTIPSDKFVELIGEAKSLKNLTALQIKKLISNDTDQEVKKTLIDDSAISIYFTREPSIVEWNTLKEQIEILLDVKALNIRIEYSTKFIKKHEYSKAQNLKKAKAIRKQKKESQLKIDRKDFSYNPLFHYEDYDYEKGEYIS